MPETAPIAAQMRTAKPMMRARMRRSRVGSRLCPCAQKTVLRGEMLQESWGFGRAVACYRAVALKPRDNPAYTNGLVCYFWALASLDCIPQVQVMISAEIALMDVMFNTTQIFGNKGP